MINIKCDKVEITDKIIRLYIKIKPFSNYIKTLHSINIQKINTNESYIGNGIDITGKYVFIDFMILNYKRDIEPYVK